MDHKWRPDSGGVVALKEQPPSEAVVLAVAEAAGVDPTEPPPLHEAIDTDALDALFRQRPPGTITFRYYGYTVTVRANAEIIIHE